jgi:hypothetical protein
VPLSEYEERMIAEFERQLSGDPAPEASAPGLSPVRMVQYGLLASVLGLIAMVFLLPVTFILGLFGFLATFAGVYLAALGIEAGGWEQWRGPRKPSTPRRRSTDV